jgi:diguanylate cyclase (GGDEF)-like protein
VVSDWIEERCEQARQADPVLDRRLHQRLSRPDRAARIDGAIWLRSVAQVLAKEARRPADLAARYGGEEFVLLLPRTDAKGCALVGERVRGALHELGMPHAMNPPSNLVTMSLGGATDQPEGIIADYTSLIEAADRALYAAKDGGRDRLVMSGQVIAWPNARSA